MEFRDRLKAARLASGLSQSEVARRIGVRPSAVNHMESGRVQTVMADTLVKLGHVLGVNPTWLRDGYGSPANNTLSPDESEAVAIFRALPDADREVWIGMGRMLMAKSGKPSAAAPYVKSR